MVEFEKIKAKKVDGGRAKIVAIDLGGTNLRIAVVQNRKILKG